MKVRDQCGNEVELVKVPTRIVSLVPSQTELLAYLGLDELVVGITRFCVHPEDWFRTKTRVGGTKNPDLERIKTLHPDLVLANKEENNQADIECLRQYCPVYTSDIHDLPSSLQMIRDVGTLTQAQDKAENLSLGIETAFQAQKNEREKIPALYLIWYRPWMAAGRGTFIHSMMKMAGFENVIKEERYPGIEPEQFKYLSPEVVLLSSEPFPFKEKHRQELQEMLPDSKILLVDGELFSWYGPRMLQGPEYFTSLRGNL